MKKKSIILYIGCLLATPLFAQQNNLTADSKADDVALRDSKAQNKALRDSLAAATSVLAYHPDSIDLRLKKAAWNIQLEQWSYAKDDLDKVLFLNNTNIAGLFYRAFVNEKLLRYNFARLDYQNLLVLVPGNFQAQLGLALLNEKDKHYTEAYDGINNLIEQYPDSATAYAARGGMEKERGQLELAEYDYARQSPSMRIIPITASTASISSLCSTESWMPIANWKLCRRRALRLVVCKISTADCVARNNR